MLKGLPGVGKCISPGPHGPWCYQETIPRRTSGGRENVWSLVLGDLFADLFAVCCAAWRGRRYPGFLVLLRAQLVGRLREQNLC